MKLRIDIIKKGDEVYMKRKVKVKDISKLNSALEPSLKIYLPLESTLY